MDNLTLQIAKYAHRLSFQEVPTIVIQATKKRIIDSFGCAFGGSGCEAVRIGRRLAQGAAPNKYSGRIIGLPDRTTADWATFVNTSMIRYLDFNDGHHGGHPSDMIGAILAIAESAGADGERLITSIIVAYEVALRIVRATKLRELGWDQGFAVGVGVAAGVGHLLKLPLDKICHGIAITAVANVPMRASRAGQLSHWKGSATAYACRNGVFSALLASEGMTSPEKPFEGRHGLWEQITGPFKIAPFHDEGGKFILPESMLKFWPADGNAQGSIWAALKLREELTEEEITYIDIGVCWSAWHENASEPEKWDPTTRETADHSIPYLFARAFVDGIITMKSFDHASYLDPSLRSLMNKIRAHKDDEAELAYQSSYPHTYLTKITVTRRDHDSLSFEILNPKGQPQNPMNDDEIDTKFKSLSEPILGQKRAAAAVEVWKEIDKVSDLSQAMDLFNFNAT
jgi:2-methylcitrate dehydratase